VKGVLKLGIRFAFFTIHPMEIGKTMMNSFLFNVGVILMCEIPVIQFCSQAFSIYARVTSISSENPAPPRSLASSTEPLHVVATVLFGTQIRYTQPFATLIEHNIFLYLMFLFIALTSLYVTLKKPKDSGKEIEKEIMENLEFRGQYR
jgi:LMBR1 domain-containing protein 1